VYVEDKRRFRLTFKGQKRSFLFEAANDTAMLGWVKGIQEAILSGYLKSITGSNERVLMTQQKAFWKESKISEQYFLDNADTGDILLFRSRNFASKLQRMVTSSNYDHVALVLRYSNNNIAFIEATE